MQARLQVPRRTEDTFPHRRLKPFWEQCSRAESRLLAETNATTQDAFRYLAEIVEHARAFGAGHSYIVARLVVLGKLRFALAHQCVKFALLVCGKRVTLRRIDITAPA